MEHSYMGIINFSGKPKIRGVQNGASSYGKLSIFRETKNPRCSEWSIQLWEIVNVLGK